MKAVFHERISHPFPPVFDGNSKILILGTFPSVKSRESGFYYGHRQNRFWKVLSAIFAEPLPATVEEKKSLLLRNHIALWDMAESCGITGSSDASIRDVIPADIKALVDRTKIGAVFTNGGLAKRLYDKYALQSTGIEAVKLPSTSPANARNSLDSLIGEWGRALMEGLGRRRLGI